MKESEELEKKEKGRQWRLETIEEATTAETKTTIWDSQ